MGADYRTIYKHHAAAYDRMVRAEDCDRLIQPSLAALTPLQGQRVVEVGAGTGRLTRMLLAEGANVWASDASAAMLEQARANLSELGPERLELHVADARALWAADGIAVMALAGWVFGHMRHWEQDWMTAVGQALAEMERVCRDDGTLVILETLGMDTEEAAAPNAELAEYYRWLEEERGFTRQALRTDFNFDSPQDAADATRFFFGDTVADGLVRDGQSRLHEWTGLWSLRLGAGT